MITIWYGDDGDGNGDANDGALIGSSRRGMTGTSTM